MSSKTSQTKFTSSTPSQLNKVQVMGILNVTPDSFSDGGQFTRFDSALKQVEIMIDNGVDIIDIGGESTRPGAVDVSVRDEIDRVIPLLKAIKSRFGINVSIDTSKAEVMAEAITYGADMINDVRALQNKGCLEVIAQSDIAICLMHMQGMPRTMQKDPQYKDIIDDILQFFKQRINCCAQVGINKKRLVLDPGFGFGKTVAHNYEVLAKFAQFNALGLPLLAGVSRKSMIGDLLHRNVHERLAGSLTAAIVAVQQGARIIRVHDVQESVDAIKILTAVASYKI
ncbi:MAG: dihydropteroate synthase [Colwellia sp.]|jgi:dihydropteroate synthase|nr:dihydropteroate synthase [Colwellia sp.]PCI54786.1 MAG: dihydropteroate synthase [Gammaproteobacteria bacterium]